MNDRGQRHIRSARRRLLDDWKWQLEGTADRFEVVDAMEYWLSGDVSVPSLNEFFARFGREHMGYRMAWREGLDNGIASRRGSALPMYRERDEFIRRFGFAVPTREALDCVLQYSPILEIGAGSGAWARLLKLRGCDIVATDPSGESFSLFAKTDENGMERQRRWEKLWHPIIPLEGKTAVRRFPERNVFCSWPSLNKTWLRQAAKAMRPGRTLIAITEDACAEDTTWDYIAANFREEEEFIGLPNWYFLHDHMKVWVKHGKRGRG